MAVATLILLGVVSHFSDPYNPWINLLARVGNVCVFLYILWRAAGKAIVDGLSNRRAAIVDELDSLAVRKAAAEEQLAAMIEKIDIGPKGAVLTLRNNTFPNPMGLVGLIQKNHAFWKIRPDQKIVVKGDWPTPEDRLKVAERITADLARVAGAA